jgi:hypothetical protein
MNQLLFILKNRIELVVVMIAVNLWIRREVQIRTEFMNLVFT